MTPPALRARSAGGAAPPRFRRRPQRREAGSRRRGSAGAPGGRRPPRRRLVAGSPRRRRGPVALDDVHLPDGNGFELAARLTDVRPPLSVLLTAAEFDDNFHALAEVSGAR